MFKKVLLLFFCIATAPASRGAASSSLNPNSHLALKNQACPHEIIVEIKKLDALEFSEEDYAFFQTVFPHVPDTFENFKKSLVKKHCFFFKLLLPTQENKKKQLTALSIHKKSNVENSVVTEIMWFGVDKNQQKMGIGRSLMNHIETNLQSDVLSLMPLDESVVSFYTKLGFQEATSEKYGKYNNPIIKFCTKREELEDPIYLPLNQEKFPDWPQIEIQKLHISEFSKQDYAFLKKIFPAICNTFETFKHEHLKEDCFFFKAALPKGLGSEKHLALAICRTLLIENDVLLTKVFWIAVDHACQGKGIGKTFMNHIETNTQSDVLSLDPSENAIPFYIKLGFKEILSEEKCKKYHKPYVKFSGKNPQHA